MATKSIVYDTVTGQQQVARYNGVPVGTILPFTGFSVPDGYALCDGSSMTVAASRELTKTIGAHFGLAYGLFTAGSMTSGSSLITLTSHGFSVDDIVFLDNTASEDLYATPPSTTSAFSARPFFVTEVVSANTFRLALTEGGAAIVAASTNGSVGFYEGFLLPDARDLALIGRGNMGGSDVGLISNANTLSIGDTGGADSVTLTSGQLPSRTGYINHTTNTNTQTGGGGQRVTAISTGTIGNNEAHNNLSPFLVCDLMIRAYP